MNLNRGIGHTAQHLTHKVSRTRFHGWQAVLIKPVSGGKCQQPAASISVIYRRVEN
jgi:hypothetical protein